MFLEEAIWIKKVLDSLNLRENQTVLDLGSGTEEYRCSAQPHIDSYIFFPLRSRGVRITHIDQIQGVGINMVLDLCDRSNDSRIKAVEAADVVLCTSLLEHVVDRDSVLKYINMVAKPGGVVIVTVPYIYRYHPDPIDTMYRPSNVELESLFPRDAYATIVSEIIEVKGEPAVIPLRLRTRIFNKLIKTLHLRYAQKQPRIINNQVSVLAVRKI